MTPRSEPLLWLQLIGLGALPLEALLLLLLLAGNDPGRLPALEHLFTWAIGALLPAVLLFRRPADPFSLLLVMTPVRARRELQRRLAALQEDLLPRIALGFGAVAALPLLIWCDQQAAQAAALAPLDGSPRLVALLLAALLLALMLWQWHQAIQSLWLLSRSAAALAAVSPLSTTEIEERRLCLGLPLLLPDPLQESPAAAPRSQPATAAASPTPPSPPPAQRSPEASTDPAPAPAETPESPVQAEAAEASAQAEAVGAVATADQSGTALEQAQTAAPQEQALESAPLDQEQTAVPEQPQLETAAADPQPESAADGGAADPA